MNLKRGQRLRLKATDEFALITSGRAEIYAVTQEDSSFRQMFLMESHEGQAVFPSFDEFEEIDVLIYAVDDVELEMTSRDALTQDALLPLMLEWFSSLFAISHFSLLAAKGDDVLRSWSDGSVLREDYDSAEELWDDFEENESIFSMLLGTRFRAEDVSLSQRIELREKYQERLGLRAVENLTGEPAAIYEEDSDTSATAKEAVFIVRRVAKALSLPTDGVKLAPGITSRLTPAAILRRLMKNGGMAFRQVYLEAGWERQDSGVMIGYIGKKRELCAILPETPKLYRVITRRDPDGRIVTKDVAGEISPRVFVCYAGFPARRLSVRDLILFMFRQCWRTDYRTILFASFFGGLIPLLAPIVTETIFSDIIPTGDREGLATVTQVMMVTGFTTAALSLMRSVAVLRIGTKVNMTAEAALWHRLLSLPTEFFRKYQAGDLLSRMNGLAAVKDFITGEYVSGVLSVVFSLWSLILMCWYSVQLTIAAGIVWFVYFLVVAFVYRRVLFFERNMIEAGNRGAGVVQEIFSGLSKFRAHGAEAQAFYLWSNAFGEEWKWNLRLRWQGNKNAIISAAEPFLLTMLLYYIVMYRMTETVGGVPHRTVDYGAFLAFSAACGMFNSSLVSMIPLVVKIFSARPHIDNLRPVLEAEPEAAEDKADTESLSGAVEVRHLSFAYSPGNDVIHDVSFTVQAGEAVAIVGPSGCGKSTLIRLLLGFETPRQGAILYDGQDLSELSVTSVRSEMGVVLQGGKLMTGDILSNIVGASELTMKDAWEAAEAAGISDDIRAMPMGMLTMISEGSGNISGGQRQRILIARAICRRPAILIFDEATSALDNRAQSIVTESLSHLKSTRIIVAHRLSTIRDADRILVMEAGRIIESGRFDELVAAGGLFSRLAARQVA